MSKGENYQIMTAFIGGLNLDFPPMSAPCGFIGVKDGEHKLYNFAFPSDDMVNTVELCCNDACTNAQTVGVSNKNVVIVSRSEAEKTALSAQLAIELGSDWADYQQNLNIHEFVYTD